MPGKQTTSYRDEGWPLEAGVEPRGKAVALSISPVSERGRNDKPEVKEEVLEIWPKSGTLESILIY